MSSGHAERVARYYEENTRSFYLRYWDDEDIHFGLFREVDRRSAGSSKSRLKSALKAMTDAVVAPTRVKPGDVIVDAGCGVGGASLDVARKHGAKVIGLTISPLQVELATRRAANADLSHTVEFACADCSREIPLPDASADAVISIEAACHFADKPRFLRECRRVLRPGGRLAMSDWMTSDGCPPDGQSEFIEPVCDAWRLAGLETLVRWNGLLERAGFAIRESEDLSDAILENARILQRAHLELLLEDANSPHEAEHFALWARQYDTLSTAWLGGYFTIGRLLASR